MQRNSHDAEHLLQLVRCSWVDRHLPVEIVQVGPEIDTQTRYYVILIILGSTDLVDHR